MYADPGLVRQASGEVRRELGERHGRLSGKGLEQVLDDRLGKWEKMTSDRLERNFPFKEEVRALGNCIADGRRRTVTERSLQADIALFSRTDPGSARELLASVPEKGVDAVHSLLVARWAAALERKKGDWMLLALEKRKNEIVGSLDNWLRYVEVVGSCAGTLGIGRGVLWDLCESEAVQQDIRTIESWSAVFGRDPAIRRICEILGRSLSFSSEQDTEDEVPLEHREHISDYSSKVEFSGIELGHSIEDLLPSELGLLQDPDTELLFDLKYAEDRLMVFSKQDYVDVDGVSDQSVTTFSREDVRGPVVLCMDTSGSMSGVPEIIAKAVAYYIAFKASSEGRRCHLINFSVGVRAVDIVPPVSMKALTDFLSYSFHGGTDIASALCRAVEVVEREEYAKADVLVVSDFVVPGDALSNARIRMDSARRQGCRFCSLNIGNFLFAPDLKRVFDECWNYDPVRSSVVQVR